MANLPRLYAQILIQGRDVTRDLQPYVLSFNYSDKESDASDEVAFTLEDTDGLFTGAWRIDKGMLLECFIVEEGVQRLRCGNFTIDEVGFGGPPDVVTVRGIAAGINIGLRTKRSAGYEGQTLRQVAQQVAQRNGLTLVANNLVGEFNVSHNRLTQNKASDLDFMARLAKQYNIAFSVRGTQMILEPLPTLDNSPSAGTLAKSDVSSYSFSDRTVGTAEAASAQFTNPTTGETVQAQARTQQVRNRDGLDFTLATAKDSSNSYVRAENAQQAQAQANALAYQAQRDERMCRISCQGAAFLVAGANINLNGFGVFSGRWHIVESIHTLDRSSGWRTDIECNQVSGASSQAAQKQPVPRVQPRPTVTRRQVNADGIGFTTIEQ